MKVHQLSSPPSPALARALAEFEAPFTYALGPGRFFRISHGEDYTLFFRAQGNGSCFIAEQNGQVVGVLGTAIRRLWMPDGTERLAAYFGDLKIAPKARSGAVLLRLARAAEKWIRPKVDAGFGVVMDGTSLMPDSYTGRVGIPGFQDLGKLMVLRISSVNETTEFEAGQFLATESAGLACYHRLSRGRYACPAGKAQLRSEISPAWLMHPDGSACGMLEDTRKAKRLITSDGSEMLSAHLSCFACSTFSAGSILIRVAQQHTAALKLPALFVAMPHSDAAEIRGSLRNVEVVAAAATVYGTGLTAGVWNINSSEI